MFANKSNPNPPPSEVIETPESDDFFESKLFKLMTVTLYMSGVGGLGFLLSVYFLLFWESKMPPIPIIEENSG